MMTVQRTPQYVHQTLASFFASDPLVRQLPPLRLMVGSSDAAYLDDYHHHGQVQVLPMNETLWRTVRGCCVHHRLVHNYYRCLSMDIGAARGLCICEDDLRFRDGFLAMLLETIDELEAEHQRYILSAYSAYDLDRVAAFNRGRLYCSYGQPFYGTQCVYYPRTVLPELAEFFDRHGVQAYSEPADLLIGHFDQKHRMLYATRCSLVQHIGRRSSGVGWYHVSPSFQRSWPGNPCSSATVGQTPSVSGAKR